MKKFIYSLVLVLVMVLVAQVDVTLAQTPPPPPSAPSQSPVGFIWLAMITSFVIGMFAIRKRR